VNGVKLADMFSLLCVYAHSALSQMGLDY